jgi:hypothetical protein
MELAELASSPRERPGWAMPPLLTKIGVALIAAIAVVCMCVGVQMFSLRDPAVGPPAGMATVTRADLVEGRHGHRSGRLTFIVHGDGGDVEDTCGTFRAAVAAFAGREDQPYWVAGAVLKKRLLQSCAVFEDARAVPLGVTFGVFALAAALWAAGLLFWSMRRDRLLTEGTAALARVTAVRRRHNRGGGLFTVRYVFGKPEEITGRDTVSRKLWRQMGAHGDPAVGAGIHVVYDPERPNRNRIWGLA